MTEFAARIRSIRPKNTDTNVVLFPTATPNHINGTSENWRGKMVEHAKSIASVDGTLDGFIVLGLWSDGKRSLGYRLPSRIPRELLPAYFAEIIRTDAITQWEAENTFEDKFEWVEQ